jgi:hypothetical protein
MNENLTQRDADIIQRPDSVRFGTFIVIVFGGNALGMAIFVGLAGLILSIRPRSLLVPYTTLLYCGLVLSPLLYWARLSRKRSQSYALRFAIAIFFYLQAIVLALGFSAIKLNILSQAEAVSDFGLLIVPLSAFTFGASYLLVRQMIKDTK